MSCYEELTKLADQAYSQEAFDALIDQYGSEIYIAVATYSYLYSSRFEFVNRLIERGAKLIDWDNPPTPLRDLLEPFDSANVLTSGDATACCQLCLQAIPHSSLGYYRTVLLSTFAYYLQRNENGNALRNRLTEDYIEALKYAESVDQKGPQWKS